MIKYLCVIFTVTILLSKNTASALFEGENCTVPSTNESGQCIDINGCQYAKTLLRSRKNPGVCGFKQNVPLVCCPVQQKLKAEKPGRLSMEKCAKYHDIRFQVYAIDIGTKALSGEFPHMAAVGYGENNTEIVWLCGGVLISHYFVLSAAHCAYSQEFGPATWIRLGDLDLKNTTDANPQDVRINQTYVHPEYKSSSHYHDIALFKMERETYFGMFLKPACLHVKRNVSITTLGVTGWGKMGFSGDSSSHLLKADLNLVDHETCAERYSDVAKTRKLKKGVLEEFQICAGDEEGKDTCPGDSGGPLHYRENGGKEVVGHFVVAGITSFGKGCGGRNSVGVYTRVSAYVGWIEGLVWKEEDK